MKRLLIMLLAAIVVGLSGCTGITDANLQNHLETIDSKETYVISIISTKTNLLNTEVNASHVYVDNINQTFMLTKELKEEMTIKTEDIIFEEEDGNIYGYIFDKTWTRHQVSSRYLSIKYFETILFNFFTDAEKVTTSNEVVYTAYVSMEELKGQMYNIMGESLDDKYMTEAFEVKAYYNKEEARFTNFTFDLSPFLLDMNKENDIISTDDASWIVDFSFNDINENFSVTMDDYVVDDYYNDFNHLDLLNFDIKFSFDMIEGSLNYELDQDIIKVAFEKNGLYKLKLTDVSTISNLVVTVLDINLNPIKTFNLCADKNTTPYWTYNKGEYYLVVSVDGEEFVETDYSFLFLSN